MDLDLDGNTDLLSGSWPGELFFFRGNGGTDFEPPVMLQNSAGQYINIGGGIEEQPDGMLLITGNAEFKNEDGKSFVDYHGQILQNTDEHPIAITGTASATHAVDWDDDGDMDILVGDIGGSVYLLENVVEGDGFEFEEHVCVQAAGEDLAVSGDAGPWTCDWDGDGQRDLLVGASDGSVTWYRNLGEEGQPRLAAGEILVAAVGSQWGENLPKGPTRGQRAKVCTTDWNGDGLLDLLLGDYAIQVPNIPDPTPEQTAEYARIQVEIDSLEPRRRELSQVVFGGATPGQDRQELMAEYSELSAKLGELYGQLPPESETHGWVWLFLRQRVDG